MPELPEVETVRRQLHEKLCGMKVADVCLLQTGRERPVGNAFATRIIGKKIDSIQRRAKLLVWRFSDGEAMTAHLKMTGRFVFVGDKYVPQKHDRMIFNFVGARSPRPGRHEGIRVVWSDIRKFGFVNLVSGKELEEILSAYGPEPLENLIEILAERFIVPKTRVVKAALLNQTVIAGVGNIYADEALHRAGIRPTRRLGQIKTDERFRLVQEIKNVLSESVAQQGTSANDYVDTRGEKGGFLGLLRVYGREGEPCTTCNMPIKKIVLNQRGTHYCERCQK